MCRTRREVNLNVGLRRQAFARDTPKQIEQAKEVLATRQHEEVKVYENKAS